LLYVKYIQTTQLRQKSSFHESITILHELFFTGTIGAMTIHLLLIRHGRTEWIEAGRVQGSTDSPLSPRGRREAALTAEALRGVSFQAVFSSPMGRASETAEIICGRRNTQPIVLNSLREMNFGWYEGRKYFDVPQSASGILRRAILLFKTLIAQCTGEPLASVRRRAADSWVAIRSAITDGNVLVVSHGVLLNFLLDHLLPGDAYGKAKPVYMLHCSITELTVDKSGSAQMVRLNDTSHLKQLDLN